MTATKDNLPSRQGGSVVFGSQQELFCGPLPSPEHLQGYKNIDDGYAERIFKMAEDHNAADVAMKRSQAKTPVLGQVFSFLISIAGFGTSVFFGIKGTEAGVIAAIIGGIAPIIIAALSNLKR
jgi:uncharacterized membrane protein